MSSSPAPPDDRRSWPRRRRRLRVLITYPQQQLSEPMQGWILDRSRGGLRLAVSQKFETGIVLQVKPITAPARARWVRVQVQRCCRRGQQIELGCRFVSRPSVVTMLLFG